MRERARERASARARAREREKSTFSPSAASCSLSLFLSLSHSLTLTHKHSRTDLCGISADVGSASLLSLVPHLHRPDHVGGAEIESTRARGRESAEKR